MSSASYRLVQAIVVAVLAIGSAAWGSAIDSQCTEDCAVEVENQLPDTEIEVYLCPTFKCDYIGNVATQKSKVFELPEQEWEYVQLHIREAPTHKFINLRCERHFVDRTARVTIQPTDTLERCVPLGSRER